MSFKYYHLNDTLIKNRGEKKLLKINRKIMKMTMSVSMITFLILILQEKIIMKI